MFCLNIKIFFTNLFDFTQTITPLTLIASESTTFDLEPIWTRRIIVNYNFIIIVCFDDEPCFCKFPFIGPPYALAISSLLHAKKITQSILAVVASCLLCRSQCSCQQFAYSYNYYFFPCMSWIYMSINTHNYYRCFKPLAVV